MRYMAFLPGVLMGLLTESDLQEHSGSGPDPSAALGEGCLRKKLRVTASFVD